MQVVTRPVRSARPLGTLTRARPAIWALALILVTSACSGDATGPGVENEKQTVDLAPEIASLNVAEESTVYLRGVLAASVTDPEDNVTSVVVDWGDGETVTISSAFDDISRTHDYAEHGRAARRGGTGARRPAGGPGPGAPGRGVGLSCNGWIDLLRPTDKAAALPRQRACRERAPILRLQCVRASGSGNLRQSRLRGNPHGRPFRQSARRIRIVRRQVYGRPGGGEFTNRSEGVGRGRFASSHG